MTRDQKECRATTRRRFFVTLLGSLAAVCGAAGAFAWISRRHHGVAGKMEAVRRRMIRALYGDLPLSQAITQHYDYLLLDSQEVERFAREYENWRGDDHSEEPIDEVFSRFLLSTDFFLHGTEESRPIRYLRLYDPYLGPCSNPFLRPLDT